MKKTNIKKALGMIAALCLCASAIAPVSSMAATITIKDSNVDVTLNGKSFSAYKILNAQLFDNDTAETLDDTYNYTVVAEWKNVLTTYFRLDTTATDAEIVAKIGELSDNAEKQAFAQYLAKNIPADVTATASATASSEDSVEIDVGENTGYYMVVDNTDANDTEAISAVMLDTTTSNVEISLKADAPKIDKKIWEDGEGGTADDKIEDGELYEANTANIGEDVKYVIKSTVPDTEYYTKYSFVISDIIEDGLTFNKDVTITLVDPTDTSEDKVLVATEDYTVAYQDVDTAEAAAGWGEEMYIVFTDMKELGASYEGWDIVVQYSAEVNEDANVGDTGNVNSVKLTYSNNPSESGNGLKDTDNDKIPDKFDDDDDNDDIPDSEDDDDDNDGTPDSGDTNDNDSTKDTEEEKVVTYLSEFTIKKVDAAGKPLTGAEFTLYSDAGATTAIELEKLTDGSYTIANADTTSPVTNVAVDDNGEIKIYGLAEGIYYIKETKAPAGYNAIEQVLSMTTSAKIDSTEILDASYTFDGDDPATWTYTLSNAGNENVSADSTNTNIITVINKAGGLLPGTGGIGTTLFTIGGIAFMMGAAGMFIVKKRREAE